ncbi:hypothetical protein B0H14DRAFT_3582298 [Mycena olivaceomarginata]|nr:hypothetical protein B0H14DRAFT_3582298 [Mycena olivaceomarginata]
MGLSLGIYNFSKQMAQGASSDGDGWRACYAPRGRRVGGDARGKHRGKAQNLQERRRDFGRAWGSLVTLRFLMAFTRNTGTDLFPLFSGFFSKSEGRGSRILNTLSNAGVCVSVTTVERLKKMLKALQEISGLPEAEWAAKARIIIGDWLTSNNIRGTHKDCMDDINAMEHLNYIDELSVLWHFALNATHMIMRLHFGDSVLDPGSLAKHKGLLNRTWDAEKPNYADAKALIHHSLTSRILYEVIVKSAKNVNDDYYAPSLYFIRDALIFCVFEHSVAFADAGGVLRVLKYWALSFPRRCISSHPRHKLRKSRPGSSIAGVFVGAILQVTCTWSRIILGQGIVQHIISLPLKLTFIQRVNIAKGSGVTVKYIIEKGSAPVEAFREVSHQFARTFGFTDHARRHKEVNVGQDLCLLTETMMDAQLHVLTPNRPIYAPLKVNKKGVSTLFDLGVRILNGGEEELSSVLVDSKDGSVVRIWGVRVKQKVGTGKHKEGWIRSHNVDGSCALRRSREDKDGTKLHSEHTVKHGFEKARVGLWLVHDQAMGSGVEDESDDREARQTQDEAAERRTIKRYETSIVVLFSQEIGAIERRCAGILGSLGDAFPFVPHTKQRRGGNKVWTLDHVLARARSAQNGAARGAEIKGDRRSGLGTLRVTLKLGSEASVPRGVTWRVCGCMADSRKERRDQRRGGE